MYTVYIIKSINRNWHYVGMTNNLSRRIDQHNNHRSRATKPYAPFVLMYKKEFSDRISARDYEKFLKIRSNKEKVIQSL